MFTQCPAFLFRLRRRLIIQVFSLDKASVRLYIVTVYGFIHGIDKNNYIRQEKK